MVTVRTGPTGTTMEPCATPPATEMVNTSGGAMSGAVTCATKLAAGVPDTSALTRSATRAGGPVGSLGMHDPRASSVASAAATRQRATARADRGEEALISSVRGSIICTKGGACSKWSHWRGSYQPSGDAVDEMQQVRRKNSSPSSATHDTTS